MTTEQHGPVGRAGIWESLLLVMPLFPCSCVFLPCVSWQQGYSTSPLQVISRALSEKYCNNKGFIFFWNFFLLFFLNCIISQNVGVFLEIQQGLLLSL